MNTFGTIYKITIFGESHGKGVGLILDNCPAGLPLLAEDFETDMQRRKGGILKGTTSRKEEDTPDFLSGVFQEKTTGSPLTLFFENKNTRSSDYEKLRAIPRPGHADFVANKKFGGHEDYRGGGHFSGRLTVCLVGAGVIAKKILATKNITIESSILEIGGETDTDKGLQKAIDAKDSIGGIIDCRVKNLPIGIGEPFFNSVEAQIAHLAFSIPAVKGIEFGAGFAAAKMFGSQHNDILENMDGKTKTNHSGGIVGGLTNGNDLYFKIAIKPTASTPQVQNSLNRETGLSETFSIKGRHDLCIALRVPVVVESIAAIALLDLMLLENHIPRVL